MYFIPDTRKGVKQPLCNDVFQDVDKLIYLTDRDWGLNILERSYTLPSRHTVS